MAGETVARRYATAIFQLACERGEAEDAGKDLRAIADALYEDETTKGFYLSPVIDRKEKERVLAVSFEGKADEVALHAVLLLVRKRREPLLPEIVRQYGVLQRQARGAEPLAIATAKPLQGEELRSLVARLEKIYGKTFDVQTQVEPDLIGGVRVMMGDRRVDGSVAGRLDELTRTLFAQN